MAEFTLKLKTLEAVNENTNTLLKHYKRGEISKEDILELEQEQDKNKYSEEEVGYLIEALKEIEAICDNQNTAHEHIWRVAYNAIEQFKNK